MEPIKSVETVTNVVASKQLVDNAVQIANVLELVSSVIYRMANTNDAISLGKEGINKAVIVNLIANRVKDSLLVQGV